MPAAPRLSTCNALRTEVTTVLSVDRLLASPVNEGSTEDPPEPYGGAGDTLMFAIGHSP